MEDANLHDMTHFKEQMACFPLGELIQSSNNAAMDLKLRIGM